MMDIMNITAVPLTSHRHTGLDPVSSKSLKPLDSGLRRNDGRILFIFMFPVRQVLDFPKHSANHTNHKIKLTGQQ